MEANLSWIANFIWGIADDVLRDLYVRGKYRDVILPFTVLRRLDAVLEATKDMNDEQFEAVLNVMTVAGKAEANSEMFTSVGASAEVDPATVQPTETKEMQILRARYQTK